MSLSNWFKLEFEILDYSEVNDGGISVKTYSTLMTIPGLMRQLSGNEILANEKLGYKSTHKFYCDIETIDVRQSIRDLNGKVFEIRSIKNPMEFDHHLEVDCECLEQGQVINGRMVIIESGSI